MGFQDRAFGWLHFLNSAADEGVSREAYIPKGVLAALLRGELQSATECGPGPSHAGAGGVSRNFLSPALKVINAARDLGADSYARGQPILNPRR